MGCSQICHVNYERIVEPDEDETEALRPSITTSSTAHSMVEVIRKCPRNPVITDEELKLCFRRLTLTVQASPNPSTFRNRRSADVTLTIGEERTNNTLDEGELTCYEKLNIACDNLNNPIS
jgi:hypothetical protein